MKHAVAVSVCLSVFGLCTTYAQKSQAPLYKDATKPIEKRVNDLLGRMTLDEKVAQLQSMWTLPGAFGDLAGTGIRSSSLFENGQFNPDRAKESISNGLGTYAFLDEFFGMSGGPRQGVELRNQLQEWNMKDGCAT
jgi:beta-glucosidase